MATEKRLIDANALMFEPDPWGGANGVLIAGRSGGKMMATVLRSLKCMVDNAPTVDAVEVVHGHWEPRKDVFGFVRCSVCHDCNIYDDWPDGKKWNYCPNCGAKMDGERKDNE